MTPFSASDAALEGFQLIRRRWRVVLGWAGFNLLALIMLVVVSAVLSVVATAVAGGKTSVLALGGLAIGFCALFAQAIIAAGVFRLELRPEEPAFMHLRLGRDELRLVIVWLITITGAWVVGWVAALAGHVVGAGGVWIELLAAALIVYFGMRFSLTPAVSFAERRIDFPRVWRLTRGRALALLGMAVLSFCLIGLLMVVVLLALALFAVATGGFGALASVFGGADALQAHPGLYLLAFAIEIVLTPVLWVLAMAPLVAAYRAFVAGEETAQAASMGIPGA